MSDDLRSKFDAAKENEILLGQQSGSVDGLITRGAAANPDKDSAANIKSKREKQTSEIWDIIEAMCHELAALQDRMAHNYKRLEEKYGEDVVGDMAAAYLDEDTNNKLQSDEERLSALAQLFLDENGNIKDKYKHLDEAQYVRDWQRTQVLKPIVEKHQGRDTLTPKEQTEVLEVAQRTDLADKKGLVVSSDNDQFKTVIDTVSDTQAEALAQTKHTSNLTFD